MVLRAGHAVMPFCRFQRRRHQKSDSSVEVNGHDCRKSDRRPNESNNFKNTSAYVHFLLYSCSPSAVHAYMT